MNGNQITIIAVVAIIAFSTLAGLGVLHIPEGAVDKLVTAVITFVLGLGLPRPDVLKRALGVPVYTPPTPPETP